MFLVRFYRFWCLWYLANFTWWPRGRWLRMFRDTIQVWQIAYNNNVPMGVLIYRHNDIVIAEKIHVASPLLDTFVVNAAFAPGRVCKRGKEVRVEKVDPLRSFYVAPLKVVFEKAHV
jgi:hypothetical protein